MFKWAITIRFKFSCLITLKFFSKMLFVKRLIPDANSCWDPYSVWKSKTELKSSKIQNYDRKYFAKLLAKTEFPRLFRWRFLFPKYSSSMLLLSIKSTCFCWQQFHKRLLISVTFLEISFLSFLSNILEKIGFVFGEFFFSFFTVFFTEFKVLMPLVISFVSTWIMMLPGLSAIKFSISPYTNFFWGSTEKIFNGHLIAPFQLLI